MLNKYSKYGIDFECIIIYHSLSLTKYYDIGGLRDQCVERTSSLLLGVGACPPQ